MAEQLLDFLADAEFNGAVSEKSTYVNRVVGSGVMAVDPSLQAMISGGAKEFTLAWNKQIDHDDEPNYSSTNPLSSSTPNSMTGEDAKGLVAFQNNSWQVSNLLRLVVVQPDPAMALVDMIAGYWRTRDQRRLIASAQGIIADNEANDAGDMVYDIYSDVVAGSITDAMRPDAMAFINTTLTMGDSSEGLTMIAMHSITKAGLEGKNLIDSERQSDGSIIVTYRGMLVIVDDTLPVIAGANSPAYYTYLFGTGAFGFAPAPMQPGKRESAVAVNEAAGDGGGVDTFYHRRNVAIHPYGFSYTATPAGFSPSIAELKLATSWDRKVSSRKLVQIAVLKHNN